MEFVRNKIFFKTWHQTTYFLIIALQIMEKQSLDEIKCCPRGWLQKYTYGVIDGC